jgi:hypothetical protein
MRSVYATAAVVALLVGGCGGSGNGESSGTVSSGEVESSVKAQLAKGGASGGVVDLGNDPPKLVTCTQDPAAKGGWRCKVTTAKGRSMLCLVKSQSGRKVPLTPVCGPTDN